MLNSKPGTTSRYRPLVLAIGFMAAAALGRASLIMNVQPVTYAAGSTGDTLDVTLTNTGPSGVAIAGFSFGLSVGTSNLSFTGVSAFPTTAVYIFSGQSLFGPTDISVQPPNLPGQTLEAEDVASISASTIASGTTLGLGHVTFNLGAATPPGGILLSFIAVDDSLSDAAGIPIAFSTVNGSVTVGTAPVPEPATSAFVCTALIGLGAFHLFRRRTN
jgi:hypothetical protein